MTKNFRFTKQKRIIYEEVLSRFDHPTAMEIYESIHKKYPGISQSTVYRNLDILSTNGLIRKIDVNGFSHYDLTTRNHYHILCKYCNKIVDACINYQDNLNIKVSKDSGFIINDHALMFTGICPDCQKKIN